MRTPAFIVGSGRCGSTLLAQLLERHREVAAFYELQSLSLWLRRVRDGRWPPSGDDYRLDERNIEVATQDPGYNWKMSVATARAWQSELAANARSMPAFDAIRHWVNLYHAAQMAPDRSLLVHKTPALSEVIPELRALYPACPIINLLRHPCAVVASYLQVPWGPGSLDEAVDWYIRRTGAALRSLGPADPSGLHLTYEKLVADPKAALREVFRTLSIAEDLALLEQARVESSRIDRWRTSLPSGDAAQITEQVFGALPALRRYYQDE